MEFLLQSLWEALGKVVTLDGRVLSAVAVSLVCRGRRVRTTVTDNGRGFVFRPGNINGMGLLGYESVVERDYPVVMGILVISSLLFLLGNILSDLCVAFVDPRVRFGEEAP